MAMFRQIWDMVQTVQPQQPSMPMWPQQSQPAMPAPPTNPDPASMMKWFQEMFAIVRQAQPAPAPVAHLPQPQMAAPQVPQLPNTPAPPGYRYTGYPIQLLRLEPINNNRHSKDASHRTRQREPMGQRPYYPQQGEQHDRYDPRQQHQAPPDPLRESMSTLRRAMAIREELDELLGGGGGQRSGGGVQLDGATDQDPDSPVIVERGADVDLVRNREDGSIRGWDTILINTPRTQGRRVRQRSAGQPPKSKAT
jgi:hypothetical protein